MKDATRSSVVGYTTGVFDLFHIGHLNLLQGAKRLCDRLIVGVTTDEAAEQEKGRKPIMPYHDRARIISSINVVDGVIPQTHFDKYEQYCELRYDIVFVGNDWANHPRWTRLEESLAPHGAAVVYLPYTTTVSTSKLIQMISEGSR
jgi:glycerol-3-phosphate cytidylyltransferase